MTPKLYSLDSAYPAPLPFRITLSNGDTRTDPSSFTDEEIADAGYTRAASIPEHDPAIQRVEWQNSAWVLVDLPSEPEPPEPTPETLGRLQFIVLCQSAGGMTDAMLVDAQKNEAFEAFWIKFQMASAVERDDPITRGALDALAGGGYLPEGKAAVVEAWPKG